MELEPDRSVDWFVLDDRPVIFQETHQKIVVLDDLASLVWSALWPSGDFRRPFTRDSARREAAQTLAFHTRARLEQASLFVDMCLEQWRAAQLIGPCLKTSAPCASPRPDSAGLPRMSPPARDKRKLYSFRLRWITISIENDDSLEEAIDQVLGHLPRAAANEHDTGIFIGKMRSGYRATDWRGQSILLKSADDVVAWLKMAILYAAMEQRHGSIALHAAVVARRCGTTMLVGNSGSGKSTLAAALCTQGFCLVAEDAVLLDTDFGTIGGLPFSFTAKEGSWPALQRHYPEMDGLPVRIRRDGKRVKYLRPRRCLDTAPVSSLRQVIFPAYVANTGLRIQPMNRTDALAELLKEALSPDHVLTRSGFRTLCRAVAGADVWRLEFSDLDAVLAHIRNGAGMPAGKECSYPAAADEKASQP